MTEEAKLPCLIRLGLEGDLDYVQETLAHHAMRGVTMRFSERKQRVLDLIGRDETVLRMAVLPDDEDAFLGFAIVELPNGPVPGLVHYVYVRRTARRQGVATRLLEGLGERVEVADIPRDLPDFKLPKGWRLNVQRSRL